MAGNSQALTRKQGELAVAGPEVRERAASAATWLVGFLADPASAGPGCTAHLLLSRPRRGMWMTTWVGGLSLSRSRDGTNYAHDLLPGWFYTRDELQEMLDDLRHLAATGLRPTEATR